MIKRRTALETAVRKRFERAIAEGDLPTTAHAGDLRGMWRPFPRGSPFKPPAGPRAASSGRSPELAYELGRRERSRRTSKSALSRARFHRRVTARATPQAS